MASKINYNNKAPFQTREDIPVENKVLADDMNEIKTVVNTNADELDTANQNIENLQNRVTTLETDNTTNKSNISNLQNNKVDKIKGKGLSTNDYTTEEKEKLAGLENYNDTEIKQDISNIKEEQATQNENIKNNTDKNTEQDNIIQKLKDTLVHKISEQSSSITIQDCSNLEGKLEVEGNSIQEGEPSPENKVDIQNVEGNIPITVCNKNIANSDEIYNNMKKFNSTACSEVVVDDKDCIRFSNAAFRPDADPPFNLIDYDYKENTAYTIRGMFKAANVPTSSSGSLSISILYTDETYETVNKRADEATSFTELRLVSNSQKTISRIGFSYGTSNYWYLDKSSIFIAEGDTTDYVENQQQQQIVFPLQEGQKLMKGDYLGNDGIHHKRTQIELDGTENYYYSKENGDCIIFYGLLNFGNRTIYSNTFKCFSNGLSSQEYMLVWGGLKNFDISIKKSRLVNISSNSEAINSLKAWLSQQKEEGKPVILEYELAEEIVEPYTEAQQEVYNQLQKIQPYKLVTNIFTNLALLKFNYIADTKKYIDNQINQRLSNIENQILELAGGN